MARARVGSASTMCSRTFAVVDQHDMPWVSARAENPLVRKLHARRVARRGIGIKDEFGAFGQHDRLVGESAYAQLRPLQVDQYAGSADPGILLDPRIIAIRSRMP